MNILSRNTCLLFGALSLSTAARASVSYDFNLSNGGFVSTVNLPFDGPWVYGAASGVGGTGAWSTDGQAPENSHANTTDLTSALVGVTGAGQVTLSFAHRWSFEFDDVNWDGGAVFLSVNGGAFTQVPGASFTSAGYNGVVGGASANASELHGLPAYVGASEGYANGVFLTSMANLGPFAAGDTLQLRFRAASDTNTSGAGAPDWVIDNVSLSNVTAVPEPSAALCGGLGLLGLLRRRRAR